MDWFNKKKKNELYFALAVANESLEDAKFTSEKDCKVFFVTGEMNKRDGIPRTMMKEVMERFINKSQEKEEEGEIKISEKLI